MSVAARRKFWGWGLEGEGLAASEIEQLGAVFAERLGIDGVRAQEPPRVEELDLRAPRLAPPASLEPAFSTDPYDRAAHTYGRSFRDLVRAFRRDYAHAPDLVAFPRGEDELVSVLDWCSDAGVAAIPFGGGSSVVGGVEPDVGDGYRGVVSVDLRHLQGVLEVDRTSRAARIAAGTLGPALEAQLKPHGLTLRHFPQSFEWSTLGGWIATRSGGHFATLHTHIDEFVESVRVVTPRGVLQTRRLPASGAGPSRGAAVLRLRGHAGRDHRGVDARAAAAAVPGGRLGALRRLRRRGAGVPGARAVRAPSGQLPPARPRRGADVGKRRRVACDSRARLRVRGSRAGTVAGPGAGDLRRPSRRGSAAGRATRPRPGGLRSCAAGTCATAWSGSG